MARHRHIRNINEDDYLSYDEHYYSSVDDDYGISPATAQKYLYNGNKMAETLVMSPKNDNNFDIKFDDFTLIEENQTTEIFHIDDDYPPQQPTTSISTHINFNQPSKKEKMDIVPDLFRPNALNSNEFKTVNNIVEELDFDALCSITNKKKMITEPPKVLLTSRPAFKPITKLPGLSHPMFVKAKDNDQRAKTNKISYIMPKTSSLLARSMRKRKNQDILSTFYNLRHFQRSYDPMKVFYSINKNKVPKFFLFDVPEPTIYHVNTFTNSDMSRNYLKKLPVKRTKKMPAQSVEPVANVSDKPTAVHKPNTEPASRPLPPSAEKIDRSGLIKMYQDSLKKNYKPSLNLITVGHVDAGKSTLMGNLLCQCEQVSQKQLSKFQWDSQKIGKGSFAFAWILDQTNEERERGVTTDVSQSTLETEKKRIILLDAPGHRDFVPQVISGASQTDFAIVVVNATEGEFETGFEENGQTREHTILLRMLGVTRIIVAVNKMDKVNWSKDRFEDIKARLGAFLKTLGMQSVDYVPVSGLLGVNLTDKSGEWCKQKLSNSDESDIRKLAPWYNGPSLLGVVDSWPAVERDNDGPLRFVVSDIYKPTGSSIPAVCGRIISGGLTGGVNLNTSKIVCHPSNQPAIVKAIKSMCFSASTNPLEIFDESTMMNNVFKSAFSGDQVALFLQNIDPYHTLKSGDIISDPDNLVPNTNRVRAKLTVFKLDQPITKGYPVIVHHLCNSFNAKISKLISCQERKSNMPDDREGKRPRFITSNSTAEVELTFETNRCIDLYENCKPLGRFMLRVGDNSIAGGIVTKIVLSKSKEE